MGVLWFFVFGEVYWVGGWEKNCCRCLWEVVCVFGVDGGVWFVVLFCDVVGIGDFGCDGWVVCFFVLLFGNDVFDSG